MQKEVALQYLTNQMSLRIPQAVSLTLFADYLESDPGQFLLERLKNKSLSLDSLLTSTQSYLSNIKEARGFTSFERAFPTYTFALATGVGKTRLMGAFVAYLYLVHDIHHFLLVAPSLTIYRKLLDDFSRSNNPKYVFRGVAEINSTNTRIVTSDNFKNQHGTDLFGNKLEINIFNIQQFAQKEMTGERGITKEWESAGRSHFEYLRSLPDLVVMLDEAHHYHASAALNSLDLMNPLFGLEFTATPLLPKGGTMKNVLYAYNLGDAIRGDLVKDPWVGTEADVDFRQFDSDAIETDVRKIHLACYFHERAKVALFEYASNNNLPVVKPVMLIVTKDTDHAKAIFTQINSPDFRSGAYIGKVLEIHTKLKGDETEENIQKLISLEDPNNPIEIVIHVNMLKEGWDVNNVYTILPLRQSSAQILTEQTIGRGLRLPYGHRTGAKLVDRLVLVAHENYAKIIELAKDSELIQGTEQVREEDIQEVSNVVQVQPTAVTQIIEQFESIPDFVNQVASSVDQDIAPIIQAQKLPDPIAIELKNKKINEYKIELARTLIDEGGWPAGSPFANYVPELQKQVQSIIAKNHINIPRFFLTPVGGQIIIHDFNLDTTKLSSYPSDHIIKEERLQQDITNNLLNEPISTSRASETTRINTLEMGGHTHPPSYFIMVELQTYDYIDYMGPQKPILLKLVNQAVDHYRTQVPSNHSLLSLVSTNARQIAKEIYQQINEHKETTNQGFEATEIKEGKKSLETYNYSFSGNQVPVTLSSQIDTFSSKLIYTAFIKACHQQYRFDSSEEVRLAYLLEQDPTVVKWLHPAPKQFENLKYRDELGYEHDYEPDFVIELDNELILAEVKADNNLSNFDVLAKKSTGIKYCEVVSTNVGEYGIEKPWRYILLPASRITLSATVVRLLADQTSQQTLYQNSQQSGTATN